jgi:hypothetical protein
MTSRVAQPIVSRSEYECPGPTTLAITLVGDESEHARALDTVRRVLGADRDLAHFDRGAARIPCRIIVALGQSLVSGGFRHYTFPTLTSVLAADDDLLRAAGLSVGKLMTLRRVGEALAAGTLDETVLEQQASPDAAAILRGIKGIGPWTAAVILLRGLGRCRKDAPRIGSSTRHAVLPSVACASGSPTALGRPSAPACWTVIE